MISKLSMVKQIPNFVTASPKDVFCCTGKFGYMAPETMYDSIANCYSNLFSLGVIYNDLFFEKSFTKMLDKLYYVNKDDKVAERKIISHQELKEQILVFVNGLNEEHKYGLQEVTLVIEFLDSFIAYI